MLRMVLVIFVFASCSSKQKMRNRNVEVVFEDAQSYTYNLVKQTYTVHSLTKPDTTINFNLTAGQIQKITDKYYDLGIDELKGNDGNYSGQLPDHDKAIYNLEDKARQTNAEVCN